MIFPGAALIRPFGAPSPQGRRQERPSPRSGELDPFPTGSQCGMAHAHDHDHDDHHHDHEHGSELSDIALRVRALEIDPDREGADRSGRPRRHRRDLRDEHRARATARGWWRRPGATRPTARGCGEDATAAIAELGYSGRQGEHMVVVENTPGQHNLVVCTLCSCYPWSVLGLPPVWYKSAPYRSRAVIDPRGVLAEFGVTLPADTRDPRVGFHGRAALPRPARCARPGPKAGARSGSPTLVTRDSMIGIGLALAAGQAPHERRAGSRRHDGLRPRRARDGRAAVPCAVGAAGARRHPRQRGAGRVEHRR